MVCWKWRRHLHAFHDIARPSNAHQRAASLNKTDRFVERQNVETRTEGMVHKNDQFFHVTPRIYIMIDDRYSTVIVEYQD